MKILGLEVTQNKHFPKADNWMWDYCIYLGSIEDQHGKYDLGIYKNREFGNISWAIVDGDEPESYHSNTFYCKRSVEKSLLHLLKCDGMLPWKITYILAKDQGYLDDMYHIVDIDHLDHYKDYHDVFMEIIGKGPCKMVLHKECGRKPEEVIIENNGNKWYTIEPEPDITHVSFIEYKGN